MELDEFICSICQNIFDNPVWIKCGHSFCKICLNNLLEYKIEKYIYYFNHLDVLYVNQNSIKIMFQKIKN